MKSMRTIFLLLSLCGGAAASASVINVTADGGIPQAFGTGYNSRTQALYGVCVDNAQDQGDLVTVKENRLGDTKLHLASDQSQVADKLGVNAEGRYRSGVLSTSASAEFLKQSESSDFSLAYNYFSEQKYIEKMEASRKNPIRALPGFTDDVNDPDGSVFYKSCGDEYVYAQHKAARLLINVFVSFVSKRERTRFAAEFGLKSDVAELKTKVENDAQKFNAHNEMTVTVMQIGGDPSYMGKILCPKLILKKKSAEPGDEKPQQDETMADPECVHSSMAVATCAFGQIQNCTEMIAKAIAYSSASEAGNFPEQIRNGKDYSIVAVETKPFATLGKPFKAPPSTESEIVNEATIQTVKDIFEKEYRHWKLDDSLYRGSAPRLSAREKHEMEILRDTTLRNAKRAALAIDKCYGGGFEKCNDELAQLRSYIGADNRTTIAQLLDKQYKAIMALTEAEDFVQFCDIADADHPEITATVNALRAVYSAGKATGAASAASDSCLDLATWLEAQTKIEIKDETLGISDLRPIAALKNLQSLTVVNQKVADVSPLLRLKNLEALDIHNNRVTQESLETLAALRPPQGRLTSIDAQGNQENMRCPLASETQCKLLSFTNYANISSARTRCEATMFHQAVALDSSRILASGGASYLNLLAPSSMLQIVDNRGCQRLAKSLFVARCGHTMTKTANGIWVIGGATNKIEFIDPVTLEPKVINTELPESLTFHTATELPQNAGILIVGGATDKEPRSAMYFPTGLSNRVQILKPDGTLETIGHLSVPRSAHTATRLKDGRVLILGGYSMNGMLDFAEIIDPVKKTVTLVRDTLPTGRMDHVAVLLDNGHVLVAGGSRWQENATERKVVLLAEPVAEMVDFDPYKEKFRILRDKLEPARSKMQAVVTSDHRVLFIGGTLKLTEAKPTETGSIRLFTASSRIDIYDPRTEGVYPVGKLLDQLFGLTATPLTSNSILIFGGAQAWSSTNGRLVAEDPVTSTELLVYRPR